MYWVAGRLCIEDAVDRMHLIEEHPALYIANQKRIVYQCRIVNAVKNATDILLVHSVIKIPDDTLSEDQIAILRSSE